MAKFMTREEFGNKIRDGEALGIPKAEIYKSIKAKGYSIEGEPADKPSVSSSGGVFGYFSDTLKNATKELGAVAKFGAEVALNPSKGLEFVEDTAVGLANVAVGGVQNLYEAATGNKPAYYPEPTKNPDGSYNYPAPVYPEKSIYQDPVSGGTPPQQMASGLGMSAIKAASNPLETFKENPLSTLSVAAPLASSALGGASALSKMAGATKLAKGLGTASKAVSYLDPVTGAAKIATKAPSAVANYGKSVLGTTTGAGDEAVSIAASAKGADSPFYQGMRGNPLEQARIVVSDSKKALSALRAQRSKQYLQTKEALTSIQEPLSPKAIYSKLQENLKDFGIDQTTKDVLGQMVGYSDEQASALLSKMMSETTEGALPPLVKAGLGEGSTASKISKAITYTERWDDFTPDGLDKLQQALSSIDPKYGTKEFAFVEKLRKSVKGVVEKAYPEYAKLMDDYTQASTLIEDMERAIGSQSKQAVESTVLKLSQSLKSGNLRFEIKNALVQQLEDITSLPLRERVAGMTMAQVYPRGLSRVGVGLGTAGQVAAGGVSSILSPSVLMALAMTSPRVVGEFLGAIGIAKKMIPTAIKSLKAKIPLSFLDDAVGAQQVLQAGGGVDEAAKVSGTSKNLSKKFSNLTPEEIAQLTPEEKATGILGGSDSVGGGKVFALPESDRVFMNTRGKWRVKDLTGTEVMDDFPTKELALSRMKEIDKTMTEIGSLAGKEIVNVKIVPRSIDEINEILAKKGISIRVSNGKQGGIRYISGDTGNGAVMSKGAAEQRIQRYGVKIDELLNKTEALTPSNATGIPKELEPLAKEARKYKSAEDFIRKLKSSKTEDFSPEIVKSLESIVPDDKGIKQFTNALTDIWYEATGTTKPKKVVTGKPTPIPGTNLFVEDLPF